MQKFNLSKPKKYTDKQTGEEKTFWQNIGTMTEFEKQDGSVSRIIEIPAIGLECNVFPIEPKQGYGTQSFQPKPKEGEINTDEIPY